MGIWLIRLGCTARDGYSSRCPKHDEARSETREYFGSGGVRDRIERAAQQLNLTGGQANG